MRAIILAAGMGTRLRPLTETTPKSLIRVGSDTLIERQIRFLHERHITDITVVTGYLAEQFDFLAVQYGVQLVHNDAYAAYNNFYSMYLVRDRLPGAYVIDADNYLVSNFLLADPQVSYYFSAYKEGFTDEWLLHVAEQERVIDITVTSGSGTILSGISYWSPEDGQHLAQAVARRFAQGDFADLYWDNIVLEELPHLRVHRQLIPSDATYEIDTLDDLQQLRQAVERTTES